MSGVVRIEAWLAAAAAIAVAAGACARGNPCAAVPYQVLQNQRAALGDDPPRLAGCLDADDRSRGAVRRAVRSSLQTAAAVAVFRNAAAADGSSRAIAELGVAYLLSDDPDQAVAALEQAATLDPTPATYQNLGAAYYVRGSRRRSTLDLVRALDATAHGHALAPRDPALTFNEALALNALGLRQEARALWQQYLATDAESPWAASARQHVAAIADRAPYDQWLALRPMLTRAAADGDSTTVRRIVERFPQPSREYAEEALLGGWAAAVLRGECAAADAALRAARVVADVIADVEGDPEVRDVVSWRERPARCAERAASAQGIERYLAGRVDLERDADAVPAFTAAQRALSAASDPFASWAAVQRLYAGFAASSAADLQAAFVELTALASAARARGYRSLAGRAAYQQSSVLLVRGDYSAGVATIREAIDELGTSHETEYLVSAEISRANALQRLGDYESSWSAAGAALARVDEVATPKRRFAALINTAIWAVDQRFDYAARVFLDVIIARGAAPSAPGRLSEAHLHRARVDSRLGDASDAAADLDEAARELDRIADPALRAANRSEWLVARAEIASAAGDPRAPSLIDEATGFFETRGYTPRLALLRTLRGRAALAAGDAAAAERDFTAAIDGYESYRRGLSGAQLRMTSIVPVWDAFEELVRLEATRRQDPEAALAAAERSRARTLYDAIAGPAAAPASIADLRATLEPASRVVYYAALADRLLVWTVGRSDLSLQAIPGRRDRLEALCARFRAALEHDAPAVDIQLLGGELYDLVFAPVAARIPADTRVIVVADGGLTTIPFAALWNRRTHRYLAEDTEISVAPSLSVYLAASRQLAHMASGAPRSILVGPEDRRLAGATAEIRETADVYGNARVLADESATPAAFAELARRYDVVHFSGHAISTADLPLMAHLDFGERGMLFADDIARVPFDRTRLVVLAACRTGYGIVRRGEGVISLARPFLGAGVPAVVATLWDVDDAASFELFRRFHRALHAGATPSRALRAAQREMLASNVFDLRTPSAWAAPVVIGGTHDGAGE